MGNKIKLLESNCIPDLEKTINRHLTKGWVIRGNMVSSGTSLVVMLCKDKVA